MIRGSSPSSTPMLIEHPSMPIGRGRRFKSTSGGCCASSSCSFGAQTWSISGASAFRFSRSRRRAFERSPEAPSHQGARIVLRHTAVRGNGHYQNAVNAGGAKVQITGAGRVRLELDPGKSRSAEQGQLVCSRRNDLIDGLLRKFSRVA